MRCWSSMRGGYETRHPAKMDVKNVDGRHRDIDSIIHILFNMA